MLFLPTEFMRSQSDIGTYEFPVVVILRIFWRSINSMHESQEVQRLYFLPIKICNNFMYQCCIRTWIRFPCYLASNHCLVYCLESTFYMLWVEDTITSQWYTQYMFEDIIPLLEAIIIFPLYSAWSICLKQIFKKNNLKKFYHQNSGLEGIYLTWN